MEAWEDEVEMSMWQYEFMKTSGRSNLVCGSYFAEPSYGHS